MMRASASVGFCALVTGCFVSPPPAECVPGSEGCPCIELQCETDLVCRDAVCVQDGVANTGTGPLMPATDSTTDAPSTTADGSSGSSATTSPADGSTTSDPTATAGDTQTGGSSTGMSLCGNGVLDTDEVCDGTPGCEGDCTLTNYDCNPLNNAPCVDGFKCSVVEPPDAPVNAVCLPFAEPPPGELHEGNCFFEAAPHDEWCDVGLACALSSSTDACDVNCCVEFCDLTDVAFECAFKGDTCQPFLGGASPTGLAQLGFCVAP